MEKFGDLSHIAPIGLPNILTTPTVTARVPEFRNVGHPLIRRTKSYDVQVHVGKVKHGFAATFDPVFVVSPSLDRARSFRIDYRIHAANMPDAAEGQLHVIVTRS